MEFYNVIILLLAIAIGLHPIATKLQLPYPIVLLVVGIIVGFIPSVESIHINPEIIFLIFLPPFLYDAAYNISFKDFKRNFSVISLLAFNLVFITASIIAVVAHYILGLDWAISFILGAILSPPDAIAATGITKDLNLPHRTSTILEGESLINDASALVALKFAMAAIAGSEFIAWKALLIFLVTLIGGGILGWILGRIFISAAKRLTDKDVIVSLNLLLPFAIYILAEKVGVSGVIAVVAYGLTVSQLKDRLPQKSITQSKSVLETTVFILSGLIFILIGLEFPQVLKNIPTSQFLLLIGAALLIFLAALLVRMVVIFSYKAYTQRRFTRLSDRIENMDEKQLQHLDDRFGKGGSFKERLSYIKTLLLNTKEAFVIGWSGMRGIVSLASALALPLVMADGSGFPYRDTLIFLTVTVVILMLLIQGMGLPIIVKHLNFDEK